MENPECLDRFSKKELELIKQMDCLEYATWAKICDVYHKMALDAFASNRNDAVADSVRRCFNALFGDPIQLSNGKYLHHGTPEFDNLINF